MKGILLWLLILFPFMIQSQERPVEIVLDSIKTDSREIGTRVFTLHYHIQNLTGKTVSFFLNTDSMVPLAASSMSIVPHYQLLQDSRALEVSGIFTISETKEFNIAEIIGSEKNEDTIHAIITRHFDRMTQEYNNKLVNSVVRLSAGEMQRYSIKLRWDLQRYQKQGDNEYYLEATSQYHLELSMHLLLEELRSRLTPEQFEGITADKSFIKGWFTSNRLPVDLGD